MSRSLGELGIGLSVVFGIFVVALLAELWYIFSWKKSCGSGAAAAAIYKSPAGSSCAAAAAAHDCLKSSATQSIKAGTVHKLNHRSSASAAAEFVREASMVGSFGGYPVCTRTGTEQQLVIEGAEFYTRPGANLGNSCEYQAPAVHLLFPIKEETKEDMELAAGVVVAQGIMKPNSRLRSRTPSDVLTIPFTSGSSSPAASADTPFTTPPSSPPPAKLSPYAACAVRQMCRPAVSSSPAAAGAAAASADQLYGAPYAGAAAGRRPQQLDVVSPAAGINIGSCRAVQGKTPLRLLFERSPLLGPPGAAASATAPGSPLVMRCSAAAARSDIIHPVDTGAAPSPPRFYQRLSLAALFRQSSASSSSSSPCLPL